MGKKSQFKMTGKKQYERIEEGKLKPRTSEKEKSENTKTAFRNFIHNVFGW